MILLASVACARMKYIQYKDIFHKGAGSQRPQIGHVSQTRITYAIKIFDMYNQSNRNRKQFLDLIFSVKTLIQGCLRSV